MALLLSNGPGDPKDVVEGTQIGERVVGLEIYFWYLHGASSFSSISWI